MSTLGKVCLCLTLLLLLLAIAPIPGQFGGWAPKLLVFHNQWSEKLRAAKASAEKASQSHFDAEMELRSAQVDYENTVRGWDQTWTIPARGPDVAADAPAINKRATELILRNIGTGSTPPLMPREVTDESGAQQTVNPVVFAFYSEGDAFKFAGEFVATDISPTQSVLRPVHPASPEEAAAWPVNVMWRFRSVIPASSRTSIDSLYAHARRSRELATRTNAKINDMNRLSTEAENALEGRKRELLGDPDREPVDTRPEFVEGLLKVNEDVEEERNQLMLEVDLLRRAIQKEEQAIADHRAQLRTAAESLPAPATASTPESRVSSKSEAAGR